MASVHARDRKEAAEEAFVEALRGWPSGTVVTLEKRAEEEVAAAVASFRDGCLAPVDEDLVAKLHAKLRALADARILEIGINVEREISIHTDTVETSVRDSPPAWPCGTLSNTPRPLQRSTEKREAHCGCSTSTHHSRRDG